MTREEALRRYPRLVAHLMAESLGYLSARCAAAAVANHASRRGSYNEWYMTMATKQRYPEAASREEALLLTGRDVLGRAFRGRRFHGGYMANLAIAQALVEQERRGAEAPLFGLAGWM